MSALKKALKDKLVAKYPGALKKLSSKGQELLVDKLSPKVTAEDEIEDFVNGLENIIEPFIDVVLSESDRRVTEATKKPAGKTTEEEKTESEEGKQNSEDVPAWAKGLLGTVQALQKEIAGNKVKTTQQQLIEAAKAKGIPEQLAKRVAIGEEFDMDATLTELESDWAAIKQADANGSVGDIRVPQGSNSGGKKEVSAAITAFAKKNAEQANQQKSANS